MTEQKLDQILQRLALWEPSIQLIATIDAKVTTIESEVSAIKVELAQVREEMLALGRELEAATNRITGLEVFKVEASSEMKTLRDEVDIMRSEMGKLQQLTLANDFVMHGLPPTVKTEQAESVLANFGHQIGINFTADDFSRKPFAVVNKTKTYASIIGTFATNTTKVNVFKAFKDTRPVVCEQVLELDAASPFRGKEVKIRNSLTQLNRNILTEAHRLKGDLFRFAWDVNGRIHLKKDENSRAIEVRSLRELHEAIASARR